MKINKVSKRNFTTYGLVIAAYCIIEIMRSAGSLTSLMSGLLVPVCTYAILAVSLNLVVGISGELSLGHAGFMCIGAFTGAFFSKCVVDVITVGWIRITIAILIGAIIAGIFGALIGMPVLRLKGDYLAIVTLGFGEIIKNVVNAIYIGRDSNGFHFSMNGAQGLGLEEDGELLVNGALGITNTPKDSTFFIGIVLLLITLAIVLNLINSRDGRAIMSIRDNRIAAESLGINITKYKLISFTISAALAGAAGVLYAHNLSALAATTKNFGYTMSIMILVFVVLGGIGNIRGSIIGAVVLTLIPELLRSLSDYRMLIYSIILIVMMLFNWAPSLLLFRERVASFVQKKLQKRKEGK